MEWLGRQWERRKVWGEKYGSRLVLAIALLLVGALSFEAGWLRKSLSETAPMVIRVTEPTHPSVQTEVPIPAAPLPPQPSVVPSGGAQGLAVPNSTCAYVGSKKSNKYHDPNSRCAKQIKPDNQRCFTSREDAQAKGYLPGCL